MTFIALKPYLASAIICLLPKWPYPSIFLYHTMSSFSSDVRTISWSLSSSMSAVIISNERLSWDIISWSEVKFPWPSFLIHLIIAVSFSSISYTTSISLSPSKSFAIILLISSCSVIKISLLNVSPPSIFLIQTISSSVVLYMTSIKPSLSTSTTERLSLIELFDIAWIEPKFPIPLIFSNHAKLVWLCLDIISISPSLSRSEIAISCTLKLLSMIFCEPKFPCPSIFSYHISIFSWEFTSLTIRSRSLSPSKSAKLRGKGLS